MKKNNFPLLVVFFALTLALSGCTQLTANPENEIMEEQRMEGEDSMEIEEDSMMEDENSEVMENDAMESEESVMDSEETSWEFKDGVYTTQTSYKVPSGTEKIEFMVTVDDNGLITDVDYKSLGEPNPTSVKQQASFGANIDALVVGKKVLEVEAVDRVGTSSLSSGAFFKALESLESQS